ncbi:MAG: hypothetical protein ACFB3T_09620 [Geminicoccaceae bacterium]
MSVHRYPHKTLLADDFRAALGLSLTAGPLVLMQVWRPIAIVLAGLALIFLWFAWRCWQRHRQSIELTQRGVQQYGPGATHIDLDELRSMHLAFYGPRKSDEPLQHGWFRLTLADHRRKLGIESTIEGFDTILDHALEAAAARELVLDPTTHANLERLQLTPAQRSFE